MSRDRVRIGVFDPADDIDRRGLDLVALPLSLGRDQFPGCAYRAASGQMPYFALVVWQITVRDHLDRVKARTVMQLHKGKPLFGVPAGSHPAPDGDFRANGRLAGQGVFDSGE